MATTKQVQVSARISRSVKADLDRYVSETGMKQERVIEEALAHHLAALRELPADIIIHPRLVVSAASMEEVARRLASPPAPTQALRDLMAADGD